MRRSFGTLTSLVLATGVSLSVATPAMANDLSALFGQGQTQPKFLPVHQAFSPKISSDGKQISVRFSVTPKHYIYRDKLALRLPEGVTASEWAFDQSPTWVDDPTFGKVAVFERDFTATATLSSDVPVNAAANLRWQGCAKAGLCYPPELTAFSVNLSGDAQPKADQSAKATPAATSQPTAALKQNDKAAAKVNQEKQTDQTVLKSSASKNPTKPNEQIAQPTSESKKSADKQPDGAADTAKKAAKTDTPQTPSATAEQTKQDDTAITQQVVDAEVLEQNNAAVQSDKLDDEKNIENSTSYALDHTLPVATQQQDNALWSVVLLFLAGLLLSLTPCVYPMIPIVANIVARREKNSAKRGFGLAAAYGVGVATAYGVLGALIAWFGQAIGIAAWLQKPAVLLGAAALFVLFALMMADVITLRLPAVITNKLQQKSQLADNHLGSMTGSFMAGMLSALVVSPCVSAPMAGALAAVSASGSVAFGFASLFALGLGLSVPLMAMGAAQGKWLPKAGAWMLRVRELGALLLLAVALLLVERVFFSPAILGLWAVWFVLLALWVVRLGGALRFVAVLPILWASLLIFGAFHGATDAWRPLSTQSTAKTTQAKADIHITTLSELDAVLMSEPKVLVDLTADWCVECRIMERTLFSDRPAALADFQVVKLDISDTTDDSRAILQRYQLFGPPALLIYKNGKLEQLLLGETKREAFEQALSK